MNCCVVEVLPTVGLSVEPMLDTPVVVLPVVPPVG